MCTNICSQEKIKKIYKILALFEKQADLRNLGTLTKIRRIYRILALFKKLGGFKKSWRFYKNQSD
jgi:hypothetical protein